MKIVGSITLVLAGIVFSCNAKQNSTGDMSSGNSDVGLGQAVIVFDTIINDLGTLKEGEQVIAWYDYHNDGDAPLVIEDIIAGCGCTVPQWNGEPLEPGKGASIKVVFNSQGKKGVQSIEIAVLSNAETPRVELKLNSIVKSNIN